MHPPICWGEELNLLPNFQKGGGLDTTLIFRGRLVGKRGGGDLFEGGGGRGEEGSNFYIKNNQKSEIFNDKKKFVNKNLFLCKKKKECM